MIPPTDLYVLRRLITDRPLNGEVALVSAELRPLVNHLAGLDVSDRQIAWGAVLSSRSDQESIVAALAQIDPDGPAPAEDKVEADLRRFKLTRASTVVCRDIEWEWTGRIPRGMLTLLVGDPKLGKSLVTVTLAAARSRGTPHPGETTRTPPGSVVMLSAEDDPARTIVPRLRAAGADLDRVHLLEAVYLSDGAEALPSLVADLDKIEAAIESAGDCRLVIVDPVSAYLGSTDDHRNSELRGLLTPLKALAERRNVAVVLVSHLTKAKGTNALHRVTGSIAYVGACRANFVFVKDAQDPIGRRVLMVAAGCNLAATPETLAYRIEDLGDGPIVAWEADPVPITAEEALAAAATDCDLDARAERTACEEWLQEALAGGRILATEIVSSGRDAGFSKSALDRAKRKIGAKSKREGSGVGSCCYWYRPEIDDPIDFGPAP